MTGRYAGPVKRALALAAVLLLTGCAAASANVTTAHGLKKVHDPRHVTGTITGQCHYRDKGQLPDPRCTPGSIDPAVTQANLSSTICRSGYTKTVRPPESQTEHAKWDVVEPAYRVSDLKGELDHLVPLELGGSNDLSNLWVEAGRIPNPKDRTELALRDAVCGGRVTLAAAQNAIASDWLTAEKKLGL